MNSGINTLILAGLRAKNPFAERGVYNKALLKLQNRTLVEIVLDTLRRTQFDFEQLYLAINPFQRELFAKQLSDYEYQTIDSHTYQSSGQVVEHGLSAVEEGESLLVLASDNPLLKVADIQSVLNYSADYDLVIGVINGLDGLSELYPKLYKCRTWHILNNELHISGANIFLIRKPNKHLVNRLFNRLTVFEFCRKIPWLFAGVLALMSGTQGMRLISDYLAKSLDLEKLELFASRLLNLRVKFAILDNPLACCDVDSWEDYEQLNEYFYGFNYYYQKPPIIENPLSRDKARLRSKTKQSKPNL